jgi:hypothetical protein
MYTSEHWKAAKEIEGIFKSVRKTDPDLTHTEFLDNVPGLTETPDVRLFKISQEIGLSVTSLRKQYA